MDNKIRYFCFEHTANTMFRYYLTEEDYVCSWAQNELVDHFYIKKYSEEDFTNIESNVLSAKDWGGEVG